jgi:hypothetical protein
MKGKRSGLVAMGEPVDERPDARIRRRGIGHEGGRGGRGRGTTDGTVGRFGGGCG